MTYISNNLHDCYLQEKPRAEIARQVAEFEARNGRVETMPMVKRSPDTRVDLTIRADVEDKKSRTKIANSGRRRGRPKGSSTCAPVAMIHDIIDRMKKSGIRQKQVADAMNVGHTVISNIFNGYHKASPAVAERILAEVIKLESQCRDHDGRRATAHALAATLAAEVDRLNEIIAKLAAEGQDAHEM